MLTRFVIIFLFLTTIGSRGVADEFKDGDVFYCETEGLADFDKGNDWKLRSYQDQKFKFKISDGKMRFSGNSFFQDASFKISSMFRQLLEHTGPNEQFFLAERRFVFTRTHYVGTLMMVGTCDKF